MIHELIDLTAWKTKHEILKELKKGGVRINERHLRNLIKKQNKLFYNHEIDVFIAHSSKGYKVTSDREEILKSLENNHKRALDMLFDESRTKKALGENLNFKLTITNDEFICVDFGDIERGNTVKSQKTS